MTYLPETQRSRATELCRCGLWLLFGGSSLSNDHRTCVRVFVPVSVALLPKSTPRRFLCSWPASCLIVSIASKSFCFLNTVRWNISLLGSTPTKQKYKTYTKLRKLMFGRWAGFTKVRHERLVCDPVDSGVGF